MLSAAAPNVIWNAARSSTPMEKSFMLVCSKRASGVTAQNSPVRNKLLTKTPITAYS